jgi:hypothetical protein
MAATFHFCEDNGSATGSPSRGTTRSGFGADTHFATDMNWKNADDCTANSGTAYSSSPITAGNNSYTKYQYGHFSGTFNQISAGKFSLRTAPSGALATGLTLKGKVTSTYATPATSANAALTDDYTSAEVAIGSGSSVSFSTTGPQDASPTSTLSAEGYTQYLASQLQTTSSAAAGDIATITATLQYNEN